MSPSADRRCPVCDREITGRDIGHPLDPELMPIGPVTYQPCGHTDVDTTRRAIERHLNDATELLSVKWGPGYYPNPPAGGAR